MKNYQLFEVPDFVTDVDFICWIKEGKLKDTLFWEEWLRRNPSKHLAVAEAAKIVQSIEIKQEEIGDTEIQQGIDKIMCLIAEPSSIPIGPKYSILKQLRLAAAVLIIVAAGVLTWKFILNNQSRQYQYETVVKHKNMVEHINGSSIKMLVSLPDGSTVTLSPNSRLSYSDSFGQVEERNVYLSGEAFFNVSKDAAHPFRVYANELATKVLGTSFTVRSFEKEGSISVTVRTGKVSVYSQLKEAGPAPLSSKQMGGIILTPNQQLTYHKSDELFEKRLVDAPLLIDGLLTSKEMVFNEEPVVEVFQRINRYYGIQVQYDAEKFKDCNVTADLTNEPLLKKLELICEAVNASYEIISGEVIISGNGCH